MNAQVISRLHYFGVFIAGESQEIKDKVKRLINSAVRFIKDDYCFRMRMSLIYKEIGWKEPEEIVETCSAVFLHKIIATKTPKSLYDCIRFPRSRAGGKLHPRVSARTNRVKRTGLNTAVTNYNRIPTNIRQMNTKIVRRKLKNTQLNEKPP